jgi:outer membrane lipoprotein-sorting protein
LGWLASFAILLPSNERVTMTTSRRCLLNKAFALTGVLLLAVAVRPVLAADDLNQVLAKLDAASVKFRSAQADIVWDNVQTQPLPDTDSQAGTILFERKNGQLRMALHLKTDNGKPAPKDVVYADGELKLYEPLQKRLVINKAGANRAQYDMFLTVGFGGSGKDLQKNWEVSYVGTEQVDGVTAAKLQLVPRDPSLRNTVTRVLLWIDMDKGVAVKQQSFDPSENYRVVTYHKVALNGSVSSGAFEIKTASGTQVVNH